jgi:hypothetical protein
MGLFRVPFTSIESFSNMWGGVKGARPRVRQIIIIICHSILVINVIT